MEVDLTKQEIIKIEGRFLRGDLSQDLKGPKNKVSNPSSELLKFHGIYQGLDRDKKREEKKWEFMARLRLPAGRIKAKQLLSLFPLVDQYGNGTLRATTRESIQFHGIAKGNLKKHIQKINDALLNTMGACGDVVRNVMAPPAPLKDYRYEKILQDALTLSDHFYPKTRAYHELWLDGEELRSSEAEPLYGKSYLPRKFKMAITLPEDNSVDVLSNDCAIIAIFKKNKLLGYNLAIGGGMGMSHNNPNTYPRLASPFFFVGPDDLISAVEGIVKVHRDYGDRTNRKHARLKYLVEEKGTAWVKEKFKNYYKGETFDYVNHPPFKIPDHTGLHSQGDGLWYFGLPLASGRIQGPVKSAIEEILRAFGSDVIFTPDQNIIFCHLKKEDHPNVLKILKKWDVQTPDQLTTLDKKFMTCVALPSCGKALAEAERVRGQLLKKVEEKWLQHFCKGKKLSLRLVGCPNGCARPYSSEIGLVGRLPGIYSLYLGGNWEGTRLNTKVFDQVPFHQIPDVLDELFKVYKYSSHEFFGDFCFNLGTPALKDIILKRFPNLRM
ncbi:MAG: NADPH-dependent assimilatory sulfite reductase hemoprotein subunit [Bdellovibrionota bacterium]|nr:NADPH-dependent assimilatory sulfite reductase hemoprotein subunit [Bdellovibrionota bacterium]